MKDNCLQQVSMFPVTAMCRLLCVVGVLLLPSNKKLIFNRYLLCMEFLYVPILFQRVAST